MFATLDVTCHGTRLAGSNLDTVFIDIVGFISDIPTPLMPRSAPLWRTPWMKTSYSMWQTFLIQVLDTLKKLNVNATDNKKTLSGGNQIDLIPPEKLSEVMSQGYLPISAVRGFGLEHLVQKIEKQPIISTDRVKLRMRLRPGSEEWEWLRQNSSSP